jgi:hypothetical protein
MKSRVLIILAAVTLLSALTATAVMAGEITGNGQLKDVHGRSDCAYSGQEDLQWYYDDDDTMPKPAATRGDPGHAQSWGQAKPAWDFLIGLGLHPGQACNPMHASGEH